METEKQEEKTQGSVLECGDLLCLAILFVMGIFLIKMSIPHCYYAKINGVDVKFYDYPSKKDSAYMNICINIVKDVAGGNCNIKRIKYHQEYYDPELTMVVKYDGHTHKIKYDFLSWSKDFKINFGPFGRNIPKYPENRMKAYPEFKIIDTNYGYTTTESYVHYRTSIGWKSKGKIYHFDKNGNRIESPVPE